MKMSCHEILVEQDSLTPSFFWILIPQVLVSPQVLGSLGSITQSVGPHLLPNDGSHLATFHHVT
jgi:hypothetical protein